jgi:hypothetical protein
MGYGCCLEPFVAKPVSTPPFREGLLMSPCCANLEAKPEDGRVSPLPAPPASEASPRRDPTAA